MRGAFRRGQHHRRREALVRSALQARAFSPGEKLDFAFTMIEAMRSLNDAAQASLVRRRR